MFTCHCTKNQHLCASRRVPTTPPDSQTPYLCFADTGKHIRCTRHVKGKYFCFQHIEKPAYIPRRCPSQPDSTVKQGNAKPSSSKVTPRNIPAVQPSTTLINQGPVRCGAPTESGRPCRRFPMQGVKHCFRHSQTQLREQGQQEPERELGQEREQSTSQVSDKNAGDQSTANTNDDGSSQSRTASESASPRSSVDSPAQSVTPATTVDETLATQPPPSQSAPPAEITIQAASIIEVPGCLADPDWSSPQKERGRTYVRRIPPARRPIGRGKDKPIEHRSPSPSVSFGNGEYKGRTFSQIMKASREESAAARKQFEREMEELDCAECFGTKL